MSPEKPGDAADQIGLFGADEAPAPREVKRGPAQTIYVHFERVEDIEPFGKLIKQPVTTQTRWLSFPPDELFPERSIAALDALRPEEDDDDEGFGFSETKATQGGLFGDAEWWEEHWRGMPEFDQRDLAPRHSIQIDFKTRADVEAFARLVDQPIPEHAKRTRSIWFPEAEIGHFADKRYAAASPFLPKYPVYIISKGRWESRLTAKHLDRLGVPYLIVVEPQEADQYAAYIDRSKILVLPFSNLGLGSIPARNFVWDHAQAAGAARHWIFDDNIDGFFRLNKNLKTPIADSTIFRCAEDFVDRYENVAIAGFHYFMFASRKTKMPPFTLNSRVYSMILIRNDLPYRWRGRYNEDTDLSIRALKDGWCTVLFLAFLGMKATTMTMKGGNMEELYVDDGRLQMAQSLVDQHPDVTKITRKWGRWQHHVDYKPFRKNKLIVRPDLVLPDGIDNYGMTLHVDAPSEGNS